MPMKKIKVLGPVCHKCDQMEKRVKEAASGLECEVERVTDLREIMSYGMLETPLLVVDGELKLAGKLPSVAEIKKIIG